MGVPYLPKLSTLVESSAETCYSSKKTVTNFLVGTAKRPTCERAYHSLHTYVPQSTRGEFDRPVLYTLLVNAGDP